MCLPRLQRLDSKPSPYSLVAKAPPVRPTKQVSTRAGADLGTKVSVGGEGAVGPRERPSAEGEGSREVLGQGTRGGSQEEQDRAPWAAPCRCAAQGLSWALRLQPGP